MRRCLAIFFMMISCLFPTFAYAERMPSWPELNGEVLDLVENHLYVEAEVVGRRALDLAEKVFDEKSLEVVAALKTMGMVNYHLYDHEEADLFLSRALHLLERRGDVDSPESIEILRCLAVIRYRQERDDEAEALFWRVVASSERRFGLLSMEVANALLPLMRLYRCQGRYVNFRTLEERFGVISRRCLADIDADQIRIRELNDMVLKYYDVGLKSEAVEIARFAVDFALRRFGSRHVDTAGAMERLAALHIRMGEYDVAEDLYERVAGTLKAAVPGGGVELAVFLKERARLYHFRGEYRRAGNLYEKALTIQEDILASDHPDIATTLNDMALLDCSGGRYEAAEFLFRRSLCMRKEALGPHHPDLAISLNNLGRLHHLCGRYDEAMDLYERSLSILERAFRANHQSVAMVLKNLSESLREVGEKRRASMLKKRARRIYRYIKFASPSYH